VLGLPCYNRSIRARKGPHPNSLKNLKRTAGPGRPAGGHNLVPSTFKASIAELFRRIASEEPEIIHAAIRRAFTSLKPTDAYPYVQLAAYYLDGKPVETVKHQGDAQHPMTVVLELHGTSAEQKSTSTVVTVPLKALP